MGLQRIEHYWVTKHAYAPTHHFIRDSVFTLYNHALILRKHVFLVFLSTATTWPFFHFFFFLSLLPPVQFFCPILYIFNGIYSFFNPWIVFCQLYFKIKTFSFELLKGKELDKNLHSSALSRSPYIDVFI